ncbi:SDR family oxidoreductase [Synechocystis sp. PCC 7509]|uniref:SDR family oxidoreductase n=1 Tax=Synechocystis sp. PCC 7509 TaxID=927677 RepID=UPI0002ABF3E4|nr:SDR family NAD(P)-dependent oxidoreductase [Synechocystis sp. PCC 7509]
MTAKTALKDAVAVVTGASSGIGQAIALELAIAGAKLGLVGRNLINLEKTADIAKKTSSLVMSYGADLTVDAEINRLKTCIEADFGNVDILVHCAGVYVPGKLETANIADLDLQYRSNVRAPYLLTQALLPMVRSQQGQIVFINSSVIMRPAGKVGQFAATQHALKAIADSLREEVNADQVRVLSVYPGRTATPRQANIHAMEGKIYQGDRLLQAQDVALVVVNALSMPRSAEVTDINIRPFQKT